MNLNRILVISALACSSAFAATKPGNAEDQTGIVTPDIAVAFYSTDQFTTDVNGELVVCRGPNVEYIVRDTSCNQLNPLNRNRGWALVKYSVPQGRVYVGFKVVSAAYGYRKLEVYWK